MHLSDDLAALNLQRYHDFETPFTVHNARPALLMFAGDVYQGMAHDPVQRRGLHRSRADAADPLRSVRSPATLDLIQPYRSRWAYGWPRVAAAPCTSGGRPPHDTSPDDLAGSPGDPVLVTSPPTST